MIAWLDAGGQQKPRIRDRDQYRLMPGYRDPPVHSRFKPGQSGNPAGGPKGPRSKPVQHRSTYLDEKVSCKIGGKRFTGPRREAVVQIAALWSITKPVSGSKARGATEREKLPKPNLALQQLLLKLLEQEEAKERLILRDKPNFWISDMHTRLMMCVASRTLPTSVALASRPITSKSPLEFCSKTGPSKRVSPGLAIAA